MGVDTENYEPSGFSPPVDIRLGVGQAFIFLKGEGSS